MALTKAETNFIDDSADVSSDLIEMFGKLKQLNALWAGAPDFDTTITDPEIEAIAAYSGLTKQNITDALYAIGVIGSTIEGALPAFSVLASLA